MKIATWKIPCATGCVDAIAKSFTSRMTKAAAPDVSKKIAVISAV